MRRDVITHFPTAPTQPIDLEKYLIEVEENYVTDAYHSLSIEGYRVTRELIELVRSGNWSESQDSKKHTDAMAAPWLLGCISGSKEGSKSCVARPKSR